MKIVLSRKGFDSGNGKVPSPILPDGTLVSLPIPEPRRLVSPRGRRFGQVKINGIEIGPVVRQLTDGRITGENRCHLDPDIHEPAVPRCAGWRPAFGQIDAAQGHLARSGIVVGDLFLFFGWFQKVEQTNGAWRYVRSSPGIHVIYGWMRVGQVVRLADRGEYAERLRPFAEHPHVIYDGQAESNTLYLAADQLGLNGVDRPAAGMFQRVSPGRILTDATQAKRSVWELPGWFHPRTGTRVSYHMHQSRWRRRRGGGHCVLSTVGRGQEFVVVPADRSAAESWLVELFRAR